MADDLYDGQTIDARRARRRLDRVPGRRRRLGRRRRGARLRHRACSRRTSGRRWCATRRCARSRSGPRRPGATLVDFGQNLVGWLRLHGAGRGAASEITRPARRGARGRRARRPPAAHAPRPPTASCSAAATTSSSPPSPSTGSATPRSTGWPGELDRRRRSRPWSCTPTCAAPGTSSAPTRCSTSCTATSSGGMRGNFLDVPTDCPQRDERLGWTGDIAVFAPTAAFLYDVDGFLARLAGRPRRSSSAHADGLVPFVVPDALKYAARRPSFPTPDTTAIWSDAAVWVPWALWQAYGDRAVLERAVRLDGRARAPGRVAALADGPVGPGLPVRRLARPAGAAGRAVGAKADNGVVATACLYRTRAHRRARPPSSSAAPTTPPRSRPSPTAPAPRSTSTTCTPTARIASDCRTVYALAIVFDLLDDHGSARWPATGWPSWSPRTATAISTGFAGTPYVSDALTRHRPPRRRLPAAAGAGRARRGSTR